MERPDDEVAAELQRVRAELADLRGQVAQLQRQLDTGRGPAGAGAVTDRLSTRLSTRRSVLRVAAGAGVAAATGVGVAASGARPAAASTEDVMKVGFYHTATNQTRISTGSSTPPNKGALVGESVAMLLVDSTAGDGFAIEARGGFNAIRAKGSSIGVASYGEQYAFAAVASDVAAIAFGETASNGGPKLAPVARSDPHARAELDNDAYGNLWWCAGAGSPGQWRKLAGPDSAGAFHPITPIRVYDSRLVGAPLAKIEGGQARLIRIADGRDIGTGVVLTNDVVPQGARAITGNLTVDSTESGGFLTVNEGGNATVTSSTINWYGTGQTISNSFVVKVDVNRDVTVVAGDGRAHFLIDVTGYFL